MFSDSTTDSERGKLYRSCKQHLLNMVKRRSSFYLKEANKDITSTKNPHQHELSSKDESEPVKKKFKSGCCKGRSVGMHSVPHLYVRDYTKCPQEIKGVFIGCPVNLRCKTHRQKSGVSTTTI